MQLHIPSQSDTYRALSAPAQAEYKDKGSRFIAYAAACDSTESVAAYLADLRRLHPKCTHICYAYRLGTDGNSFRTQDDGEPSGTAGKPILGQIDSLALSNTLVAVVRYYGGTNLGVSGLKNAYKNAARAALLLAPSEEKSIETLLEIIYPYPSTAALMQTLHKAANTRIYQHQPEAYTPLACLLAAVRKNSAPALLAALATLPDIQAQAVGEL